MFLESPRFPENISYGAIGGPGFNTNVIVLNSGFEQRNVNWSKSRAKYDVSHREHTQDQMQDLIRFFRAVKGRAYGFRFKDWADYQVTDSEGRLLPVTEGVDNILQLNKLYSNYASNDYREIRKPVTVTIKNGATTLSEDHDYSIDMTTGVVSINETANTYDVNESVISITLGVTTTIQVANSLGVVAGDSIYLNGFTGSDSHSINDQFLEIQSVSGSGPYVYGLNLDSSALTITVGSGRAVSYDVSRFSWSGEFDVPCRFDSDEMRLEHIGFEVQGWSQISILEIRV